MTTPLELLSKEDLLIAAVATQRPVAFLVGSPLSLKDGVGVPAVTGVLELVRAEIQSRVAFALPNYDSVMLGKTGGDAYQEAMRWVGSKCGQDALNSVIQKAVLKARKAKAPELPTGDGNPDDWDIPAGTEGLGKLIARGGERVLGPVLTTNFDPLISLAIRQAGGRAGRRVLTADGTLSSAAEDDPNICSVVHLHGYWRNSETLHTPSQLTSARPKLTKSLQRLLQSRTLIVAAYGGWDDAFTLALVDLMNDEQAPLDVIWCFYESDPAVVNERYGKLLASVRPAIVMNRFRAFGGIDCHSIFNEILEMVGKASPANEMVMPESPIAEWDVVNLKKLDAFPPLTRDEVLRYFDGATPSWRHAICSDIPIRGVVNEIAERFEKARHLKGSCSIQLIRAAGGEGKSTILLQAAALITRNGGWNILWRGAPRSGLPPEHVVKLDVEKDWLIVADDAESLVPDITEAARLLHETGRTNVHFLLAARDTDWSYAKGDRLISATSLTKHADIRLRGLTHDDAVSLTSSWSAFGVEGLRALNALSEPEQQATALIDAVNDSGNNSGEGSFFGGLLAVRFGADGLHSHVVTLLSRLKDRKIDNSNHTLYEALIHVAACHAVGIPGISEKILADLLGVQRDWVQTLVVKPLGEEAAAVRTAGHVSTRHGRVAAAILVAAEETFGTDIAEVWCAIVRQTVKTAKDVRIGNSYAKIVHAGPSLLRKLPRQINSKRRKDIAVAVANASIEADSNRLSFLVGLGKTYRNAKDYPAAVQVFRKYLKVLSSKVDYNTDVRGYWYEWSVAEGSSGCEVQHSIANVWLAGLSLADSPTIAPITVDDIKHICSGLGVAFGKLAEPRSDCPYALARRAAVYLGKQVKLDQKTLGYLNKHDNDATAINTPHPASIAQGIEWLKAAVSKAGRESQDPFLKALLKPEEVSFNMLQDAITPVHSVRPKLKRVSSRSNALIKKTNHIEQLLLQQASLLDVLVSEGIERVLGWSWVGVSEAETQENRLKLAKHRANQAFKGLSPKIKSKVKVYFESQNWEPLKARDPKC
jgi:hypothetical protein